VTGFATTHGLQPRSRTQRRERERLYSAEAQPAYRKHLAGEPRLSWSVQAGLLDATSPADKQPASNAIALAEATEIEPC